MSSQNTNDNKKNVNKPLWVTVLLVGGSMILGSIFFLISNLTAAKSSDVASPEHQNFMTIVNTSIDKMNASGITEISEEEYINEDGDTGSVKTYKYYNAETNKGLSCVNDCAISSKPEDINSELVWLKLLLLKKTHTQVAIKPIDNNTYEIKTLENNSQPEIWKVNGGLITEITSSVKNEDFESKINTKITYGLSDDAKQFTR